MASDLPFHPRTIFVPGRIDNLPRLQEDLKE
jgi:hypothetical protein